MEQLLALLDNPWILAIALIVGFVLLVMGADWLVDGAAGLAKRWGVSNLVIGLTVVAFGTSMPEFVVNLVSVIDGTTDIAITNILGSNIINTFVILGLTALVYPISSQKHSRDFDIPMSIIAGIIVFTSVVIQVPFEQGRNITFIGGIVLLSLFCLFMWQSVKYAKENVDETDEIKPMKIWKAILLILLGIVGLVIGGELIVKSAVKIASNLGVSDAIIGLTVVALGTSLPELATSVVAAAKKNCDLALGNVIGSNIFNVFFILGVSAVIRPLPAYQGVELDAWIAVLGSILVWIFVKTNKEREIKRWEGGILLLVYAAYLTIRLLNC